MINHTKVCITRHLLKRIIHGHLFVVTKLYNIIFEDPRIYI